MKEETLEKIVSGEKGEVNIMGYIYDIIMLGNEHVELVPQGGGGSVASSLIRTSDYAYTHGGRVFKAACDVAQEIGQYAIKKQAEKSDV